MKEVINGHQMYFEEMGSPSGLPVVFIHGFPFSHRMWGPQLASLPDRYRGIVYDVRGHGDSEVGDGQYTIELFVDDLMALLDHLEIEQAVICGLSMGGYIALRAVERQRERFRGLVLADTKSAADTNEAKINRAGAITVVKRRGASAFAQAFVPNVFAPQTFEQNPAAINFIKGIISANDPVGISGALLALAGRTDTTPALPGMDLPTLVLVGEHDQLTTPADAEAMTKALPQAELHVIPGVAHMSNLENPVAFNRHLLAFLEQ